jgi:DNA-binding response OmpR family regulator
LFLSALRWRESSEWRESKPFLSNRPALIDPLLFGCSEGSVLMSRLLLVEADPFMQRTLQKLLAAEGYFCLAAPDGAAMHRALRGDPFDLVLLDLGPLPADGLKWLRELRAGHHLPVLLLAPHRDVIDTVAGLELGADDYLCEPFDPRELVARVRAQLRRAGEYSRPAGPDRRVDLGPITLDVGRRDAFRDSAALHLTPREFELLQFMARHPNQPLASAWLFESVWGSAAALGSKALAVSIGRLREKIEVDAHRPLLLLSIRGFGYQLVIG